MRDAPTILCEKTGRWATALRAASGQGPLLLTETRSLGQCAAALQAAPSALIAIEVTAASLETVADFLLRNTRLYPAARFVGLLDHGLEAAQLLLREAGAVDVLLSLHDAPCLAKTAARHAALAPPQELGLRESIAQRLPWKRWQTPEFGAQLGNPSPTLP
jgi:hypothetical protein